MLFNIFTIVTYVGILLPEIEVKYYPCLIVGSPLVLLLVFGVVPALLLAAAAVSPIVAVCLTAVYAARAVYTSYMQHHSVSAGASVSWYWPVLPCAFQGGLLAVSAADEVYACILSEPQCTPACWRGVKEDGLYGGYFTERYGHLITRDEPTQ